MKHYYLYIDGEEEAEASSIAALKWEAARLFEIYGDVSSAEIRTESKDYAYFTPQLGWTTAWPPPEQDTHTEPPEPGRAWQEKGEQMRNVKRLIGRLVEWLEAHGISAEEITDCIKYITK